MSKLETVVVQAIQQGQTVQRMLQDLNSRQTYEAERRQIEFIEDIRRHVREAIDTQVGAALQEINDTLVRKLDELKQAHQPETPALAQTDESETGLALEHEPGTDVEGSPEEELASGSVPDLSLAPALGPTGPLFVQFMLVDPAEIRRTLEDLVYLGTLETERVKGSDELGYRFTTSAAEYWKQA